MNTTNVRADNLNYDHYATEKYDADIRRVIPGHEELHKEIETFVREYTKTHAVSKVVDLGIGTGLTSERILQLTPKAELLAIDFSDQMIAGAKKRLAAYTVKYLFGDFSEVDFGENADIITAVIGVHHQNTEGKKKVFKKTYDALKEGGAFIFGDLVTYKNKEEAALNDARHYAYMVKSAEDEKSLTEWAYHHKFLNDLAPLEDQVEWLKAIGFKDVHVVFRRFNTALIIAIK